MRIALGSNPTKLISLVAGQECVASSARDANLRSARDLRLTTPEALRHPRKFKVAYSEDSRAIRQQKSPVLQTFRRLKHPECDELMNPSPKVPEFRRR